MIFAWLIEGLASSRVGSSINGPSVRENAFSYRSQTVTSSSKNLVPASYNDISLRLGTYAINPARPSLPLIFIHVNVCRPGGLVSHSRLILSLIFSLMSVADFELAISASAIASIALDAGSREMAVRAF